MFCFDLPNEWKNYHKRGKIMRISIRGYKNIENLEYEVEDNKLNVLIGISGSGKSAIAEALTHHDFSFNKKVNYHGDVISLIDGNDPYDIRVFNDSTVDRYLFDENKNTNIYSVLIDNEGALREARKALDDRLNNLHILVKACEPEYNSLKQIQSQLGATLSPKNKIKVTSAIHKMRTSLELLGSKRLYRKISGVPSEKVDWIIKGVPFISNSKCPFCNKVISSRKDKELHQYLHLDLSNQKKINLTSDQLRSLNTSGVSLTLKGIDKFEEEMINVGIAIKEYDKLVSDISSFYDTNTDVTKIRLEYAPQLFQIFPSLTSELDSLKRRLSKLQHNISKAIENTKSILNYKLNSINETIEMFGIPFKMEAVYKQSKIISYKLYHNEDIARVDREKGLSNGERKIISLIFFILENSNFDSKLLVFDDPVSSYDDNRRLSIFSYIIEKLKNKTVLILSHDQVFAKFAVNRSNSRSIGKVDYFDNYEDIKIIPIAKHDFQDIEKSIRDRIKQSSNYIQKIINLRFYYEIYRKRIPYSYFSRILHKDNVSTWLINNDIDEIKLINSISIEFGIDLELFNLSLYNNIDTSEYSTLEKIFLLRESELEKKLRDELSNHIHLNSKYVVSLNPYIFSFCSKFVKEAILVNITSTYNL